MTKLKARQEHEMPFSELPFYRFVLPTNDAVSEYIGKTAAVVEDIRGKVESGVFDGDRVFVDEYKVKFDPSRVPAAPAFNFEAQIDRLLRAYNHDGGRRQGAQRQGARRTRKVKK